MTLPTIVINPRILLSGATMAAAGALLVGSTFALFSDAVTATDDIIGADTMIFQISKDAGVNFGDTVSGTFNVTGLVPGNSTAKLFRFRNNSVTTPITEVALDTTSSISVPGNGGDLRTKLNFIFKTGATVASGLTGDTCSGGTDVTPGTPTLFSLTGVHYDSFPIALNPTEVLDLCVQATMDPSSDDTMQGVQTTSGFTFTAHQDVSQI